MTLTFIHHRMAISIVYFMAIAGVWGIVTYLRKQEIAGNYWGILAVGELLTLAQGALGVTLWVGGARPGRLGFHVLYGIVAVISLPAYYAISKGRDDRGAALAYGLLTLFLAGIAMRGIATGV